MLDASDAFHRLRNTPLRTQIEQELIREKPLLKHGTGGQTMIDYIGAAIGIEFAVIIAVLAIYGIKLLNIFIKESDKRKNDDTD